MAKRKKGRGGPKYTGPNLGGVGAGGLGGGDLTKKIQQLQQQMTETQDNLSEEVIEVSAGGGAITISITGDQRLKNIIIDPDVVDPDDVEMLQDLVLAAVNEALEKSQSLASERMQGLTGGLDIPGLF